jgi:uncharacterized protein
MIVMDEFTGVEDVQALVSAAQAGQVDRVREMLFAGVPVDARNSERRSALDVAIWAHHRDGHNLEMVRVLLEAGADAEQDIGAYRETQPLPFAALHEHLDLFRLLLMFGAHPDSPRDRASSSSLVTAAAMGSMEMVQLLLAAGANVNRLDASRYAPLGGASVGGEPDMVRFLLSAGARPDTQFLRKAREGAQRHCANFGADGAPECHARYARVIALLEEALGFTGHSDPELLINAARTGNADTVKRLLSTGLTADTRAHEDRTALDIAICALQEHDRGPDAIQALLDAGADPEQHIGEPPNITPLCFAARHHQVDLARVLLTAGADPDATYDWTYTYPPIHEAMRAGQLEMVQVLVEAGVSVTRHETFHHEALSDAVFYGQPHIVTYLLEAGVRPEPEYLARARAVQTNRCGSDPDCRSKYDQVITILEHALDRTT